MMWLRFVNIRAVTIANRLASVPELQNRISSTDGKRLHIMRASSASNTLGPPRVTPPSITWRNAVMIRGFECP